MLYLENLLSLFIDMSFYIVIGLIFTGLLHAFVNKDFILKHVGKDSTSSVIKSSVIGVPLPLCSCGVIPTAMYLGKSGASKGSVVSFLTSTPQTGLDSLIATYGMLGPLFAIYRAISAFISGIISGIVTNILCKNDNVNYNNQASSCCSNKEEVEKNVEQTSCCSTKVGETSGCCSVDPDSKVSFIQKIKIAFKFAFGEFLDEVAIHFIIGLLIAALISTVLPTDILSSLGNSIFTMLLMVVIGIPMYICSTASIPIAVSLMLKGISPGAAFVFLFAGPVTNVASIAVLVKSLGKKVTTIYLVSASICAIMFGLLFDYIINVSNYDGILNIIEPCHHSNNPMYMNIAAVIFGVLLVKSLVKRVKA